MREMRVVGPDQKPRPHPFYGDSWERGLDPWHADAFVGVETKLGWNPGSTGERRGGSMRLGRPREPGGLGPADEGLA